MNNMDKIRYSIKNLKERLSNGKEVVNDEYTTSKRKISVRDEYITKIRRCYERFCVQYYAKKEAKILSNKETVYGGDDRLFQAAEGENLQKAVEKKEEHAKKLEEHSEKLQEFERLREENKAENAAEEMVTEIPVIDGPVAEVSPVEPDVVVPDVPTMPAVEPSEPIVVNETPILGPSKVVDVSEPMPVPETPVAETNVVSEPDMSSSEIEVVAPAMPSQDKNVQDMDPVVQASLAQNVQKIENEQKGISNNSMNIDDLLRKYSEYNAAFEASFESSIKNIMETVKGYTSQIQKVSIEAMATKQKELDYSKAQNVELENKNASLTSELSQRNRQIEQLNISNDEKDRTIQNLQIEGQNKTVIIENKDAQIAAKDREIEKLKKEVEITSQQFKQMQAALSNLAGMQLQAMQSTENTVESDSIQKKLG